MARTLPRAIVAALDESGIMGIRAGAKTDHRFTGVWPIVVEGRVFARSWTLKPAGWYRDFIEDPRGTLHVPMGKKGESREVRVRAVPVRSERLRDAVEDAYAAKYATPASKKYVRGFRAERRRATTTEFVPR